MAGCPISWGTPNVDVAPSLDDGKKKWGAPSDEWGALDDAAPGILVHADSDGGGTDVLLPLDAGRYARVEVGSTSAWRCGTLGEASVAKSAASAKSCTRRTSASRTWGCACATRSRARRTTRRTAAIRHAECDTPVCMSGCGSADRPSGAHVRTFVDARTGAGVWRTEIDEAYATQVQADTNLETMRFTASGLGCVADVSIAKK